jgi:DNA-binding response OmpR family regulator
VDPLMARVTAIVPDLLFGSKVVAALEQAGHDVELTSSAPDAWDHIANTEVLVVDLTTDELDATGLVETLRSGGEMIGVKVLGFYAHTDVETRRHAEEAGFDLVVPRSRMHREGPELVAKLAS